MNFYRQLNSLTVPHEDASTHGAVFLADFGGDKSAGVKKFI
jgi:hypothetical protein